MLYQVTLREGVNQKEVSIRSDKDQPTVTRILDVLDKKNLILRKPDPADRRAFLIYATPEAKDLIADTVPLEVSLNGELTEGLSPEQLEALDVIMSQISTNIEKSHQN